MTPRPPHTPHGDWWTPALRADEAGRPGRPGWVVLCERAFAAAPVPPVALRPTDARVAAEAHFAPVVAPFVAVAGLPELDGVGAELTAALARTVTRTMIAEIHRVLGGEGGTGEFAAVVRDAATPAGLRTLAGRFPVLFRLLATQTAQRAAAVHEILAHLAADRSELVTTLLAGRDPGAVTGIDTGVGDTHRDGRSVSVVRFADGRRLVHKPRSLAVHVQLGAVADLIDLDLGPVADVVDRGSYGWSVFVTAAPCGSPSGVARFHRRAGALLAVLHALRATDMHCENLVAVGEHPVPIDLETVLHPEVRVDGSSTDPARWVLDDSVLRTALLPRNRTGADTAGLGTASERPVASGAGVGYVDAGRPSMRLVRGPGRAPRGANRPVLDGVEQSAADWATAVVDGFRDGYDRLVRHRAELAAGPIGAMAAAPTRVILRNTSTYVRLLDECTHPDLLVSAAARDDVLRRLAEQGGFAPAVIDVEVAQLWGGDVPVFEARSGRSGVFAVGGTEPVVPTVGPVHRHSLFRLSRAARERQAWIVGAALGARRSDIAPDAQPLVGTDRVEALTAAMIVADRLVAEAIDDGRRCNWLTVYRTRGGTSVLPAGSDLGAGTLGIALFLAEVGRLGGAARHVRYARSAVVDTAATIRALDPAHAHLVGPGAASGFGGIAYALHRLHQLLPDAGLGGSDTVALDLLARCGDDPDLGLSDGRAGGLLAVLALAPDVPAAAAMALPWAQRLARDAVDAPRGVRAEAAVALARAGRRLGRSELVDVARDLVGVVGDGADGTGTAVALATARTELDPTAFVAQRQRARAAELADSVRDDSLGRGTAGVLDLLVREPGADPDAVARVGGALLQRVQSGTQRCVGGVVALPGLLDGLAGIGWSLLRLHTAHVPDRSGRVPSLLTLDPSDRPDTPPHHPGTTLTQVPTLEGVPS